MKTLVYITLGTIRLIGMGVWALVVVMHEKTMKTTDSEKDDDNKLCASCKCVHDSVLADCMVCRAKAMIEVTSAQCSHQQSRLTESSDVS